MIISYTPLSLPKIVQLPSFRTTNSKGDMEVPCNRCVHQAPKLEYTVSTHRQTSASPLLLGNYAGQQHTCAPVIPPGGGGSSYALALGSEWLVTAGEVLTWDS